VKKLKKFGVFCSAAVLIMATNAAAGTRASDMPALSTVAASKVTAKEDEGAENRKSPPVRRSFGLIGGSFVGFGGIIAALVGSGSNNRSGGS